MFLISNHIDAKPPGKEINPDWPCIQVLIEELSWGSIWTGPALDQNSSKWVDDEKLIFLAQKLMIRKTKENEGIDELKKYIKKNNSPKKLTKLFHALFDTTNSTWKKRNIKLLNFGMQLEKEFQNLKELYVREDILLYMI